MTAIEQSSLQPVEHDARDAAYLQSHLRLQSALLGYKEALLGYKEALQKFEECFNGDGSQPPKDQSLRLLAAGEGCQELGEERVVVYQSLSRGELPPLKSADALKVRQAHLQEYMKYMTRQPHLRLV